MSKVLQTQFKNGSLIETINGELMIADSAVIFERSEKGLVVHTPNISGNIQTTLPSVFNDIASNDISVSCFVRLNSIPANNLGIWEGWYDGDNYIHLAVYNDYIQVTVRDAGTYYTARFSNTLSTNTFYHIIITWESSSNTVTIYENGVASIVAGTALGSGSDQKLYIGSKTNIGAGFSSDCTCGDFSIYDHVLTPNERAKLYSEFLNASPITRAVSDNLAYEALKPHDLSHLSASNNGGVGLIAAYNMIPNGETLVDISGEGNDGAIIGVVSSNGGMKFNGSGDYVDIGNLDILDGLTDVTFLTRVKTNETGVNKYIFSQTFNGLVFYIRIINTGIIEGRVTGSNTVASSYSISSLGWCNACLVKSGNVLKLYVNGVLEETVVDADDLAITGDDHIMLGSRGDTGAIQDYCQCEIAKAEIYDYTWSEAEVVAEHNSFAKEISHKDRLALDFGVGDSI